MDDRPVVDFSPGGPSRTLGTYHISLKKRCEHIKGNSRSSSDRFGNFIATWTLQRFSTLSAEPKDYCISHVIHSGEGVDWRFRLYPGGLAEDHVSCFLECATQSHSDSSCHAPTTGDCVRAKYNLSLKNAGHQEIRSLSTDEWQIFGEGNPREDSPGQGLENVMKRRDLLDLLIDDTLIVLVEVVYGLSTTLINGNRAFERYAGDQDDFLFALKKSMNCDAAIIVGQSKYKVHRLHRLMLAARSEVFAAMFESHTAEGQSGSINITDFSPEVVDLLLKFMYSGSVQQLNVTTATELLRAADKYALDDLKTFCSRFLLFNMDISNVVLILVHADMFNANNLKTAALEYFKKNRSAINLENYREILDGHQSILYEIIKNL